MIILNDEKIRNHRLGIWLFYGLNICLALVLGLAVYLRYRPDTALAHAFPALRRFLVWGLPDDSPRGLAFLQNYASDILWAYALTFAVSAALRSGRHIGRAVPICAAFEVLMEAAQLLPQIPGTFDVGDIVLEALATLLAGFLIYFFEASHERRMKHEEDR